MFLGMFIKVTCRTSQFDKEFLNEIAFILNALKSKIWFVNKKIWADDRFIKISGRFDQFVLCQHTAVQLTHTNIAWISLQWRHNGHDSVSNHQPYDCLLNRLFRRKSKKTSKLRVTGLCAGNSPWTGEFPAQMASNAENVSIWWRHHVMFDFRTVTTGWAEYYSVNFASKCSSHLGTRFI